MGSVMTLMDSNLQKINHSDSETSFRCSSRNSLRFSSARLADIQKQSSSESLRKGSTKSLVQQCVFKVGSGDKKNTATTHSKTSDLSATTIGKVAMETERAFSSPTHLNVLPSHSRPIQQTSLTASRTMSNLSAALDSSPESPSMQSPGSPVTFESPSKQEIGSKSISTRSSPIYPNLRNMDDHKETFGPLEIQPDVITEKVQKLCRVPEAVAGGFKWKGKPEIKVSGEKMDLEIEKGGKVLFILGEDERLEGLKPKIAPGLGSASHYDLVHIAANTMADSRESREHRRTSTPVVTRVDTRPSSGDVRRLRNARMQGRSVSAVDEKRAAKPVVYPPLHELKKAFATNEAAASSSDKATSSIHRRNMSDPTNGAFLLEMPPYQPLAGVLEEKSEAKVRLGDSLPHSESPKLGSSSLPQEGDGKGARLKKETKSIEDWEHIDEHSKLLDIPR